MAKATFEVPKLEVDAFDTRLQHRHIMQGRITSADIEKQLKGLADDAEHGETVVVYLGDDPPAQAEEADADATEDA
jgi:hypothetical protein